MTAIRELKAVRSPSRLTHDMNNEGSIQYSQNSERAALVLLALGRCGRKGLALKDLAELVGAEKPAVHRTLLALRLHGLAAQTSARGRYRLGPAALALGRQRSTPTEHLQQWKPYLAALGQEFRASAFLLERSGVDALITDMYITDNTLSILGNGGMGGRLPLGYGLGSTVILAGQDEGNQTAILLANESRYAELGLDVEKLRAYLTTVRELGYDYRRNPVLDGISGISMPVIERDGSCSAAITVSKQTSDLTEDEALQIIDKMKSYIKENE
ncbi:IclR family transcriptional regulator [Komagataeibacter rhaeticus]|uniref:IclR family transcriptional regulator n=1 Tax=Komagataeibacter rhaeticus TaxID=215221 RepID=UPI0011B58BEA|nr:IclR family transcriptional regulator C-terminal domain-containing protein [Komagataeibacter rhaeticus]GBQ09303.1 transcriptional regulator [Komagataeibacter rhaeticus DSM 16663]